MLPCIVIDFFLNNQPDALIIQIYSVIKLYMFRASSCPSSGVLYCTFGIGKIHAGFWWPLPSRVRIELWNVVPSWLCLEAFIKTCMKRTNAECTVKNSWWWARRCPKHVEFYNRIKYWTTNASGWLLKRCPQLFVHVFLSLSMYSYCCLCILRHGYPDWGFSVLFPRL